MSESEIDYSLEDVGIFRVTPRSFEDYRETFKIKLEDFPPNARILDVGSGLNQEFAQGLGNLRSDTKIVSLDASLALPISHEELKKTGVTYSVQMEKGGPIIATSEEERAQRIMEAEGGTVAALAPIFPFAEESFDRIYDNHGAFMYLTEDERQLPYIYLRESLRILKTGGELNIYPIDLYEETGNWDDKDHQSNVRSRIVEIVRELSLPAENVQLFEGVDKTPNGDINRLGVKIIK